MTRRSKRATHKAAVAFSLVEVVIALGVIAIAITAILGVLPTALQTGHSAQDETRAAQIAENMISAMASQAPTNFTNVTLPVPSPAPTVDLTNPSGYTFSADNDGNLAAYSPSLPYTILLAINPNPAGFDPGYASQVTVRVVSPPLPNPSATPTGNQTIRDFVRIISTYSKY
jgi:type II secretory pathway pseudopilin PulG